MSQIEGYEKYIIFEDGKVINTDSGREIKPSLNDRYIKTTFYKDGKPKTFSLHRLIAKAFIPNLDNKPCVDHINRDTKDNRIENLRWVSITENNMNGSCYSNTGLQYISKKSSKTNKQGFRYMFQIQRPELKHNYSNKELQPVIEYRNKFCEENDIEFNDK